MADSVIEMAVNLTEDERKAASKLYPGPADFVHLHNHTLFSPLDGVAKPEEYFSAAAHLGQPAFSVTDHGSMAAVPDAYWSAKKHKIKFIAGIEAYFSQNHLRLLELQQDPKFSINALRPDYSKNSFIFEDLVAEEDYSDLRRNRHLTILAMNMIGYRNLIKMTSEAWEIGFYYKPRIWFERLEKYHESLIVLSGCLNGPICHNLRKSAYWRDISKGKVKSISRTFQKKKKNIVLIIDRNKASKRADEYFINAIKWIKKFRDLLGDRFYLEMQMPGSEIPFGKEAFEQIATLSDKLKIPAVVTNDCLELDFPILMGDGTFKPIGQVEVGEYVITHKGRNKRIMNKVVRKRRPNERMLKIKNMPWGMTENHSLYIHNLPRSETRAKNFIRNVQLYSINSKDHLFMSVEWECSKDVDLVCDVEVEDDHTFILWGNIISHNCHYASRNEFKVQKCMMAIDQGLTIDDPNLFHVNSDEQFFKSRAQLRKTFYEGKYNEKVSIEKFEEICDNTVALAERCETFKPDLGPKLPLVPNADEKLRSIVINELKRRNLWNDQTKYKVDGRMVTYREQAEKELKRYIEKGFASYFLIIRDLVKYSQDQGWPVGPGRGSAGGSLVCFLLQIHDLDPIAWGLSSVRFMGDSRGGHMLKVIMD